MSRGSRADPFQFADSSMHPMFDARGGKATPILFVNDTSWSAVAKKLDAAQRAFVDAAGFEPKAGRHLLVPDAKGLALVLFGIEPDKKAVKDLFLPGRLSGLLPAGTYRFGNAPHDKRLAA